MYVTPDTAKVIKYPLLTQIMALKKKKRQTTAVFCNFRGQDINKRTKPCVLSSLVAVVAHQ